MAGLGSAPQEPVITGSTIRSVGSSYNWFNYSFCLFFRLGIMVNGQFKCLGSPPAPQEPVITSSTTSEEPVITGSLFILFVLQAGHYGEWSVQVPGLGSAPQELVITGSLFIVIVLQARHYGERSVQMSGLSPSPQEPVITGSTIHSICSLDLALW